jgi:hypothetical protein
MKREWTETWSLPTRPFCLPRRRCWPIRPVPLVSASPLLLKFFQYAARFPLSMREVPTTVVAYIARQIGDPEEEFSRYDWE